MTEDTQILHIETSAFQSPTEVVAVDAHAESIVPQELDTHASESGIHVSLKSDQLGMIGEFPITNSLVTSVVGSIVLLTLVLLLSLRLKMVPGRIQGLFEYIVEGGYNYALSLIENEAITKKTFPLAAAFFIFIVFFNLIKFIPGTESITFNGFVLFKPLHSDFNMTLALGITAFVFVQIIGVFVLGVFKYGSKFINIKKPLTIPLGLIELISESAKLVSLSFRLFGNVLVGGILMLLIAHSVHFVAPVPIMLFEIFVAFLQAGIFALLTLIYVKLAIAEPH